MPDGCGGPRAAWSAIALLTLLSTMGLLAVVGHLGFGWQFAEPVLPTALHEHACIRCPMLRVDPRARNLWPGCVGSICSTPKAFKQVPAGCIL